MVEKNLNKRDRVLWVIIGLILLIIAFFKLETGYIQYIIMLIGIIFVFNGIIGWSLTYYLIKYSSKGRGINRITKKDIQRAVKEYGINNEVVVKQVKPIKTNKKVAKKTNKPTTKKFTTKKSTINKPTTKKSTTKKSTINKPTTKKSTTKKSTIKKTAKKSVKKK